MKKKILIVVGVVALLIVIAGGVFGYNLYQDLQQEKKLNEESEKWSTILDGWEGGAIDHEKVDEILDRTVTTGDYAKVEKATKAYLKDVVAFAETMTTDMQNPTVMNALEIDNLQSDGLDFTVTKQALADAKAKLMQSKENVADLGSQKTIESYLDKDIDSYYQELYLQMTEFEADDVTEIQRVLDVEITFIEKEESAINLLSENSAGWVIENGQVMFDSEDVMNQYNAIVDELHNITL